MTTTSKVTEKTITLEQLIKLSQIRKDLIDNYNNDERPNYITVRDLDLLIDELNK